MPSPWVDRVCEGCGEEWRTRKAQARTCSPQCRVIAEGRKSRQVPMPPQSQHARLVDDAERIALELITMVRDEDPRRVWRRLEGLKPQTMFAVVIALAALVPDDRTPAQLLEWATWAAA